MTHRSSDPTSAPRPPRRPHAWRLVAGMSALLLAFGGLLAGARASELAPGDLMAGTGSRDASRLEVAARTAPTASRGLPVLRDLLEAPPRLAVRIDLPEAPAPQAAAAVRPAAAAVPAFAEAPPPPVLFASADTAVSDAPRLPAAVVAQAPNRPVRPAARPAATETAAAPQAASTPAASTPAASTPAASTPAGKPAAVAPVAQAAPAATASKPAPRVPRAPTLNVPTLAELAGRSLVDLKDELGAAAGFDRLGTAGLSQSIERALSSSYDVAATSARTRAQRELVDVARGGLLPKLDLRANTGREESKPGSVIDEATGQPVLRSLHSRDDTAVVLRQPVWDGSAVGEWSRQKSLYQAAVAGLGSARDQLALDAGGAHLDLLQYRIALQFARDYRTGLEKLYEYVERRSQGGGSSQAEAERVKARSINARSTVIEAQGALESALVSYRRLTGGVPEVLRTDDLAAVRELPDLESALTQAKATNPQIVQLKQTLASVEAEERSTKAKLMPKFEIEVGNFRTSNAGGRPGTTDDTRAMLVLNWNLLAGGADLAQLRSIKARQDEAKFRILDLERRLEEALRVTYNTLDAVTQRASAVRDEMTSNERVVAAFQEQLVLANRPLLDVLDAQQRLFQSRTELLRLTALQASLALQVRRQLGGLAPEDPTYREPPSSVSSTIPSLPPAVR